jgi:hypothetical protein
MVSPKGPLKSVDKDTSQHPRTLHTGEYDDDFICGDCDNKFSPWENYAAELLYETAPNYFNPKPGDFYFLIPADKYDYAPLKLCMLSMLWKMSVSQRPTFAEVTAAPHSRRLKRMLATSDPGEAGDFATVMLRLTGYFGEGTMLGPKHVQRGPNVFNIGMPRFVAAVKTSRTWEHPLRQAVMRSGEPLFVGLKEFVPDDGWQPKFNQIFEKAEEARKRQEERQRSKSAVKRP